MALTKGESTNPAMKNSSATFNRTKTRVVKWLNWASTNAAMKQVNKDLPEMTLLGAATGNKQDIRNLGTESLSLATWHLIQYEILALNGSDRAIDELAMSARFHLANLEMQSAYADNHSYLSLPKAALTLSLPAILGWKEEFLRAGDVILSWITATLSKRGGCAGHRAGELYRHFWFTVQLFVDYRNPHIEANGYRHPPDMRPYADVLVDWRTADTDKLTRHVTQMIQFHMEMIDPPTDNDEYEFDTEDRMIFPYEILLLLRIRGWKGLSNSIDVHHPLMTQPLAVMPTDVVPYPGMPMLDAAIARFRDEYPGSFQGFRPG